jgi:hypothetical protein
MAEKAPGFNPAKRAPSRSGLQARGFCIRARVHSACPERGVVKTPSRMGAIRVPKGSGLQPRGFKWTAVRLPLPVTKPGTTTKLSFATVLCQGTTSVVPKKRRRVAPSLLPQARRRRRFVPEPARQLLPRCNDQFRLRTGGPMQGLLWLEWTGLKEPQKDRQASSLKIRLMSRCSDFSGMAVNSLKQ